LLKKEWIEMRWREREWIERGKGIDRKWDGWMDGWIERGWIEIGWTRRVLLLPLDKKINDILS
jgi:hypothetical protein